MKDNSNLVLSSDLVVLVPYRREHVQRYHAWMVRRLPCRMTLAAWLLHDLNARMGTPLP